MTRQPLLPGLLIVVIGSAALGMLWLTVPRDTPTPMLHDRYAESWGGTIGDHLALPEGAQVSALVGTRKMFTPTVCAPPAVTLSNVVIAISLPAALRVVDLTPVWRPEPGPGRTQQFVTRFGVPVNRGTCGNPEAALFFTPTAAGRHQIQYSISSVELSEFTGSFVVEVQ